MKIPECFWLCLKCYGVFPVKLKKSPHDTSSMGECDGKVIKLIPAVDQEGNYI